MTPYLHTLVDSTLPFGVGVTVASWLAMFVINHLLVLRSQAANDAQSIVIMEGRERLRRGSQPLFVLLQLLFAAAVFLVAYLIGDFAWTFFAGGQLVSIAFTLGPNLQALLWGRSLTRAGRAQGSLTLSTEALYMQMAQRMFGAAVTSVALGLLLAHAAPLGGTMLLGSTAGGFLRRARQERARA